MTNSNVTPITEKQLAPSAKFTITALLEGFPVSIEIENAKADALRGMIDRLKAIGAQPPQVQTPAQSGPTKAAGVPTCPIHGTKMKASRKLGSFFCPRQAEDGSGYCPEKA